MADSVPSEQPPGGAPPPRAGPGAPQQPEPAADSAPAEVAEEASLGATEASRAVNAALLALSRTARSFTLYDAHNEAVRGFLADLRAKFKAALERAGALHLEVRPFEMAWKGDVVYVERERERSLAFRLFRDGVRRLSFDAALAWEDVLGLVEILSLRYTGVRQQEDDVVTLLHKAGFKHVHFAAVEGFVPDEEIADDAGVTQPERLPPPPDFDLPLPVLAPPAAPCRREIPPEVLAALRAEETTATLPDDAVALVLELLDLAADRSEPLEVDDVAPFVLEVRDFLVAEGAFAQLCRLTEGLSRSSVGDYRPLPALLAQFGGEETVKRLVQWARRHPGTPPPDFLAFASRLPGHPITAFLDGLQAESEEPIRRALLAVVEGLARDRPEPVLHRLAEADVRTSRELLGVVARALPERAVDAAMLLKDVPDAPLQIDVLRVLQGAAYDPIVGRAVMKMLSSASPDVVLAAAEYLATHGEQRAFDAVTRRLQDTGAQLDLELASALGQALARLAPQPAFALFNEWLYPRSLLGRIVDTPARRALQWAATSGLARLPGVEAEQLLRGFFEKTGGDLHRHCLALLVERRRAAQAAAGATGGAPGGGRAG